MPAWLGRRGLRDAVAVVIVAIAGFTIGSRYFASYVATSTPDFGQTEFSAAVLHACGRGFGEPLNPPPALTEFLASKADTFSCAQLGPSITPYRVNFTQRLYRYLMTAVAWQWRWSGISWSGLAPLFGIVFALTLCAAYGLFRLAVGPLLAIVAVAPLAVSAHHLGYLPHLRDYAKAPFILLLILILARLVMPPFERRRALLLAPAFGLVLGIGFGFRNDLLINIPPFVACLFLVTPGRWRDHLRVKLQCLAVAAAVFTGAAWPILRAYASGSNTGHVAVLGLTSNFDASLGVTRPAYNLGPHYLDGFAAALINMRSKLKDGHFVEFVTKDYDAEAVGLIADVSRHWPADIAVRGVAATLRVLEFPFTINTFSTATPSGLASPAIRRWYEQRQQKWLVALSGWGPWLTMASVIVIGAASPRAGIALVCLLLYYGGYPAVQFSMRHFFHLEFIAWWALVFIAASIGRWVLRIIRTPRAAFSLAWMRNAAMTAAAFAAILLIPLATLRAYQQRHVRTLFHTYLDARRSPLSMTRRPAPGGATAISAQGLWDGHREDDPFDVRYLAVEFSADRCPARRVPVVSRYVAKTEANDFSFEQDIAISASGPTEWLVPAYYNGQWSHFDAFELPQGLEGCLTKVSRIDEVNRLPVLIYLNLAPGWEDTSLFQRIAKWEPAS